MKKKIISCLLLLAMLVLTVSMSVPVFADTGFVPVEIKSGDTVYDLCARMGMDYQTVKGTIMILNGWDTEAQMSQLRAGDIILMPESTDYLLEYSGVNGQIPDEVAYYVIPYEIQAGDTIENIYSAMGLRYEKFASLIRLLNCIDDLNGLEVGTVYYLPTTVLYQPAYITVIAHTMQWGETSYDVFRSYGIDYNRFADFLWRFNNGADLTRIALGDKLLIPQF